MANLPSLLGDSARFFGRINEEVREGFAAPGRQRRIDRAQQLKRQQQRDADEQAARARLQAETSFQQNLNQRQQALPVSTQEAVATQGVAEVGKDNDTRRQIQVTNNTGDQVRATLPVIGSENRQTIGAGADADVKRFGGWDSTVGARMQDIIDGSQQADQNVIDRFVGDTPLSEQVLGLQREQMGMEQQRWETAQNDPMRWVDAAGRLGLMASLIF